MSWWSGIGCWCLFVVWNIPGAICAPRIRIAFLISFILRCTWQSLCHFVPAHLVTRRANKHFITRRANITWLLMYIYNVYISGMLCVCAPKKNVYSFLLHYSNLCAHFPKRRKLRSKVCKYLIIHCVHLYEIEDCEFALTEEN